ncbi:MAG: hypothetical protein ACYTDT_01195 [Planctomycetota bacterium]|jgi:YHS domain-containing protein
MKYVLMFVTAFTLSAGIVAFARVSLGEPPRPDETAKEKPRDAKPEPKKDAHEGHGKKESKPEETPEKKPEKKDIWADDVKVDLKNVTDPVSGDEIDDKSKRHVVFHGFKIFFNDAKTIKKFKRRPVQYLVPLELEMAKDRTVKQVKATDFTDPPVIPETCPMMGGDIFADEGVYMFHRGYKIYFCCWNGCATDFLDKPDYAAYGLKEADGKLVSIKTEED